MQTLLIVDGNSIINRAFYGIKLLTNKHGLFTNGIYGFLKILFKHLDDLQPEYVCVAFDLKAPTFRHKMYAEYKAQRKGMPDELRVQMPVLKEVLKAMNITIYEKEGYEADDIIGTVSRICDESGVRCCILTGDKDDLQLASANTSVLLTITRMGNTTTTVMDDAAVLETYGVTPTEFIDVKGLMGDTSDNVPGVKGIGEKTAFSYITKFKSIESLYENLEDAIVKPAARKKLEEGRDMALLSKKLCTIDRFVPGDYKIEDTLRKEYDTPRLTELFMNLEFNGFLKLLDTKPAERPGADMKFTVLSSAQELQKKLSAIEGEFVYHLYFADTVCALAFLIGKTAYFIQTPTVSAQELVQSIKPVMENAAILKVSDDIKEQMLQLHPYGTELTCSYFDIGIAAYIINPSKTNFDIASIAVDLLNLPIAMEKDILGSGKSRKTILELDAQTRQDFVVQELYALSALKEYESEKIREDGQEQLLYEIEFPLIRVLANMEITGFQVDRQSLQGFTDMLTVRISSLEEEIYALAGETFNINSTKQLGVILFEKLGLKVIKKTKTGYSTDVAVLEKLKGKHDIIEKIIEYRQAAKLKSTYGDGLLAVIHPDTGRIHSSFNQTVTVTGRISSTEPNLQNIPMRRDEGREIRKMFVAPNEDYILIDADYSQIELRLLAHISDDTAMIEAFKNGADIHTSTAANVFNVSPEEVTPLLRSRAKAVNFGICYGMGDYSLAQDLHIPLKEAKQYIENYFAKYHNVRKYLDEIVIKAKEDGYVTTMFNRRRYVPEIASSNFMTRSFGERVAMNTPIQGSAADIIKIAMVKVSSELKKRNLKSRLILQVHDELIIEAAKDEADEVCTVLESCMTGAANLRVPLVADTGRGRSWYDAH